MTQSSGTPLLTDADERALSIQAFEARYAYPLDRAIKRLFRKIIRLFRRTEGPTRPLSHRPAQ